MQLCFSRELVALSLGVAGIYGPRLVAAEQTDIAGTWRGESICVTSSTACQYEDVVYYIKDVPERPDLVFIEADKIVNGKAITMGTGQWQYDRVQHTLDWRMPEQRWHLKISGDRIEGVLNRMDGTVVRKMVLQKEK